MNKIRIPDKPKVLLIAGPTASGKSALAVHVAQRMPSVVINADSAQVYSDLHIISARPTQDEMGGIAHHLFGYVDGGEACSAAKWAADARAQIKAAHSNGLTPILVGGTGLYLRTLIDGIAPIPDIDAEIRANVRAMAIDTAYSALSENDPEAATRLSPNDSSRICRALEVILSTGKPLSYWQTQLTGGIGDRISLSAHILLPPRPWLFERIERRFITMIENGAIVEVEALMARNLDPALPVMRAIGVPEIIAMLKGEISYKEMLERGIIATRQYGKRQYTWFSRQPPATWQRIEQQLDDSNIDNIII